jgi:serine/threonine-protein kinase RsbW
MSPASTPAARRRPPDEPAAGEAALMVATGAEGLAPMRDGLAARLASEGWDAGEAHRVLLAATEALANAIEHGSQPGDPVVVGFSADARRARVVVLDRGAGPVVPRGTTLPPPEAPRGRGLVLMGAFADEMSVERPGGTLVRLAFHRREEMRDAAKAPPR